MGITAPVGSPIRSAPASRGPRQPHHTDILEHGQQLVRGSSLCCSRSGLSWTPHAGRLCMLEQYAIPIAWYVVSTDHRQCFRLQTYHGCRDARRSDAGM